MLLGIPGDNTYSNLAEAQRIFWRQTVLPLVNRTAAALSGWLGASYDRPDAQWASEGQAKDLRLVPDIDALDALAPEREALWARLEKTSFLTPNEKRAEAGYGPLQGGDEIKFLGEPPTPKFNPHHDHLGRFTNAPDGEGDGGLVHPANRRRDRSDKRPPPPPGHNNPPGPVPPLPPFLPPGQSGGGGGGNELPEFLQPKPGPGSIQGEMDGLTPAERQFAEQMRDLGNNVEIVPTSNVGQTPDFKINGTSYELKTVSNVVRTDADGLSSAISSRILNARGQSGNIIIDARGQIGMTQEAANQAVRRAYGADTSNTIQSVTIMTSQGTVYAPRRN